MSPEIDIFNLSYPDFVAFIGQANTPPGSHQTISDWVDMGGIKASSHVLDLACTTGFSSRSVWLQTGAQAIGIDQSAYAIHEAQIQAQKLDSAQLSYQVADAACLPFKDNTFTHILAGGCFGFIQDRHSALLECRRVLKSQGLLAISTFHYQRTPPPALLDQVEVAIGYRPDASRDLAYWHELFLNSGFRRTNNRGYKLPVHNENVIEATVEKFIFDDSEALRHHSPEVKRACCQRLTTIRLILNKHRCYQGYSVELWQKE